MRARGLVDVLIPRGGAGADPAVVEESTVPVIETGVGNCHVYVDAAADLDMAVGDPAQRQDAAAERLQRRGDLLVHADVADAFLPRALAALARRGRDRARRRRACAALSTRRRCPATEEDCGTEYLSLDIAVARGRLPRRGDRAHPPVRHRPHRGDRHRTRQAPPAVRRRGRRGRRDGQRLDPVHRRRRVRLRRRDRHLHPEAARPRPDGPARADLAPSTS